VLLPPINLPCKPFTVPSRSDASEETLTAKDDVVAIKKSLLKEYGLDLGECYSDSELVGGNSYTITHTSKA
jgi:hypothetical protein